jgi:hypothetical protein
VNDSNLISLKIVSTDGKEYLILILEFIILFIDGNIFKAEAAKMPIIIIISSLLNFRIENN